MFPLPSAPQRVAHRLGRRVRSGLDLLLDFATLGEFRLLVETGPPPPTPIAAGPPALARHAHRSRRQRPSVGASRRRRHGGPSPSPQHHICTTPR